MSSITKNIVSVSDIVEHTLIYRQPINLATEEIKRPYQVDVLQPNNTFLKVHFATPEFMQGIISVAYWKGFPDKGEEIIWKNLCQFTKEGHIPLKM